ncbi:helix-turn-helix domain-containing protein [Paenibacillus sp. LMG 31456]|uniref:Helix-turn-helix domain-containing protein n=1 Tax=Paenibacillus foliorum TaxID=2654974 RepID=A0A972GNV1_9BACL|nr:Crp/Fnr family transcriptional regulator [Paenibacillus foliorum]NOU93703.1 helix-turn-helix domain-containing protein [Paenibacillus foliorum]
MHNTRIQQIISLFPCFSSLSAHDWQASDIVTVDSSTKHSIIEGHLLQHALFILQGSVRIYKTNPMGREVTLYRIQGGECCSLMICSILGETEYEASADVESATELLVVPVPLFKQWLDQQQHKPLKQFIFKQITRKVIDVTQLLDDIAFKSIHHRLADFLLQRSSDRSKHLAITHEQLSSELGTAREVVSRTLKDLERRGVLRLGRGRIELINAPLLEQIISIVTKSR